VTFELLKRTRGLGIAACLKLDFRLAVRFTRGEGDFYEGVRATLIDRGSTPRWKYPTLEAVPQGVVEAFFRPLEGVQELELPAWGQAAASSRL
jgi:enoyl-CoA hydratase